MYRAEPFDTRHVEAFDGSYPELEVRIDGVFHKHRDVYSLHRVSQSLHGERVCRGARSDPQYVHAVFHCEFHVLRCCHLSADVHAGLFLGSLHPLEGRLAVAFEAARLGARLPHSGAEVVAALLCKLSGCTHHLFFTLCRTWAGDDERTFVVAWYVKRKKLYFHIFCCLCYIIVDKFTSKRVDKLFLFSWQVDKKFP